MNFQEHQNVDVGLYGVDIPIQAENLVIMIMNGSNASFALLKVFGMCNYIVYLIKSSIDFMKFNYMRINLRENFPRVYKNADFFFFLGSYLTLCSKYDILSTTSPHNKNFLSTKEQGRVRAVIDPCISVKLTEKDS